MAVVDDAVAAADVAAVFDYCSVAAAAEFDLSVSDFVVLAADSEHLALPQWIGPSSSKVLIAPSPCPGNWSVYFVPGSVADRSGSLVNRIVSGPLCRVC